MYGLAPKDYLSAIGDKLYTAVKLDVKEKNDGYQYIQILANNTDTYDGDDPDGSVNTPVISYYKACFERDNGSDANETPCYMNFPHRYNYVNRAAELAAGVTRPQFVASENYLWDQKYRNDSVKAANAGAILLDPLTETVSYTYSDKGGEPATGKVTIASADLVGPVEIIATANED